MDGEGRGDQVGGGGMCGSRGARLKNDGLSIWNGKAMEKMAPWMR